VLSEIQGFKDTEGSSEAGNYSQTICGPQSEKARTSQKPDVGDSRKLSDMKHSTSGNQEIPGDPGATENF